MQLAAGPWRGVRAAVVAVVCVSCSVVGHVAAGGDLPGAATLGSVWLAVAAVAYRLSAARWTFGRLLLVLGGGQVLLHPTFAVAAPASHAAPAPSAVAHVGGHASWVMVGGHLAAAVVLAVLLAYGDRVLWRLADVVQALLRPLARGVHGVDVVPTATSGGRVLTGHCRHLPVPLDVVVVPAAERAPPRRSR